MQRGNTDPAGQRRGWRRGELLRAGATGALLGVFGAPALARAQSPPGDDVGYVQWGATAELVAIEFYNRALATDHFGARARRRLRSLRATDRTHYGMLATALGADAPTPQDFRIAIPQRALRSRAATIEQGIEIERSIVRTYLAGVAATTDQASALLLGRVLVQDVSHLDALVARSPAFTAPTAPLQLEQAGAWLDRYLR